MEPTPWWRFTRGGGITDCRCRDGVDHLDLAAAETYLEHLQPLADALPRDRALRACPSTGTIWLAHEEGLDRLEPETARLYLAAARGTPRAEGAS